MLQLKKDVAEAFELVQKMVLELKGKDRVSRHNPCTEADLHAGSLAPVLKELKELMKIIVKKQIAQVCVDSSFSSSLDQEH